MRNRLRSALICILMLALPVQAMAVLGMQLGEQVQRSGMLQQPADEHAGHSMAKSAGHGMHQASQADDKGATGFCSLCAFCLAAAAPSQPFLADSFLIAGEPALAGPQRLVIGVADTPERPPRYLSA